MQRQDLVQLSPTGWAGVLGRAWDDEARACLAHWSAHRLPLVVTRQPVGIGSGLLALGLPAPSCWSRRRLALHVPAPEVALAPGFPGLAEIAPLIPAETQAAWAALQPSLAGLPARICGSFGWQRITGLAYLREGSDIDLLVPVPHADAADAVAQALQFSGFTQPRLDGELLFPDGAAVAWREWRQARSGKVSDVLVKRLDGVALEPVGAMA